MNSESNHSQQHSENQLSEAKFSQQHFSEKQRSEKQHSEKLHSEQQNSEQQRSEKQNSGQQNSGQQNSEQQHLEHQLSEKQHAENQFSEQRPHKPQTGINSTHSPAGQIGRLTLTAVLVASAAALQIVESPLPRFLPWLKPGLANAMTLFALLRISASAAMTVAVFRTAVAAVFMGSLLSPVHLMSFAGATSAALSMTVLRKFFPATGLATLSVFGALVNNFAQLAVVQFMFASNLSIGLHLALMIWVALPSGLIVARVTQELLRRTP